MMLFFSSLAITEYYSWNEYNTDALAQMCVTFGGGTCRWENGGGCGNPRSISCDPDEYQSGWRFNQGGDSSDIKCDDFAVECCKFL